MKNQPDEPKKFGCKEIVCSKNCVSKKFWLQKKCCVRIEFGSKIVLGSKNIGTFWVQMILDPKSLGLTKCKSKTVLAPQKLGPKTLVEIGSDIVYMDKCHQDKCAWTNVILTYGI